MHSFWNVARTAPKAKGVDTDLTLILTGKENRSPLVTSQIPESKSGYFILDAENIAACDACVITGLKGLYVAGTTRGGCGYTS